MLVTGLQLLKNLSLLINNNKNIVLIKLPRTKYKTYHFLDLLHLYKFKIKLTGKIMNYYAFFLESILKNVFTKNFIRTTKSNPYNRSLPVLIIS